MQKVAVFGASGMLGEVVVETLRNRSLTALEVNHAQTDIADRYAVDAFLDKFQPEAVINCAGVITLKDKPLSDMITTNAIGPIVLAEAALRYNIPLIHVSTDCVFSGSLVNDQHEWHYRPHPVDDYGQTKVIGESIWHLGSLITVVRTSFIGYRHGLLKWLLDQEGREILGWTKAKWSGSTVYEVARSLVEDILLRDIMPKGIIHLSTKSPITKYQLLCLLAEAFKLDVRIITSQEPYINRALKPDIELKGLGYEQVLAELLVHKC